MLVHVWRPTVKTFAPAGAAHVLAQARHPRRGRLSRDLFTASRRRCTLGNGRGLLQRANGVADVLREVFDDADTAHIAALLPEPGDSPICRRARLRASAGAIPLAMFFSIS